MTDEAFKGKSFQIIRVRATPTEAVTLSGHRVQKSDVIFMRVPAGETPAGLATERWVRFKCADYHNEHFLYLDPLYEDDSEAGKGHWFAMCTCGSPAVIVGPKSASLEETGMQEQMLVCYLYHMTLEQTGHGRHATTGEHPWS